MADDRPERPPDRIAEVLRNRLISDILDTMRRGLNVAHRPEYPQSHSDWRVAVDAMLSMFEVTRLPLARPWPPAEESEVLVLLLPPGSSYPYTCDPDDGSLSWTERHHFKPPLFYGQRCTCGAAWVTGRQEAPGRFMFVQRPFGQRPRRP